LPQRRTAGKTSVSPLQGRIDGDPRSAGHAMNKASHVRPVAGSSMVLVGSVQNLLNRQGRESHGT
jgi:hypothetical protein